MLFTIVGFVVSSSLIFYHGKRLSYYGDLISVKSGLGKVWVGLILMASVTTLPELVVGISSVTIVGSADLAVGNALGSCIFNLTILSLLDAIHPKHPVLSRVSSSNVLAASMGTILLALLGIGIFLGGAISILNWIGGSSLLLIIVYLLYVRLIFSYSRREKNMGLNDRNAHKVASRLGMKSIIMRFAAHGAMVVIAALALPYLAERLAQETGIGESFIGTLLLAASTSMPEIASSVSATRLGNADMAVGHIFGSNLFNLMFLAIADMLYLPNNLFHDASDINMVTVLSIIIMNSIAIVGLTVRPQRKRLRFAAWDTVLILIIYLIAMLFVYLYS